MGRAMTSFLSRLGQLELNAHLLSSTPAVVSLDFPRQRLQRSYGPVRLRAGNRRFSSKEPRRATYAQERAAYVRCILGTCTRREVEDPRRFLANAVPRIVFNLVFYIGPSTLSFRVFACKRRNSTIKSSPHTRDALMILLPAFPFFSLFGLDLSYLIWLFSTEGIFS